jgi:acyl transferase domain-containing protein
LYLLIQRGRLINKTQPGRMIAVRSCFSSSLQTLASRFDVDMAAHNSHNQIVFSGPKSNIENFEKALQQEDYKVTPLSVSHGFHSRCMNSILPDFEQCLKSI